MNWQDNVTVLANNIAKAVRDARKQGTVKMGRDNLKQIVSTRGLGYIGPNPQNAFERLFDDAVKAAKLPAGFLY